MDLYELRGQPGLDSELQASKGHISNTLSQKKKNNKNKNQGPERWSAIKSTGCASRKPEFNCQQPHGRKHQFQSF